MRQTRRQKQIAEGTIMATLGLKRQGILWAVMQGSEMVSSTAGGGVRAQSAAEGRGPEHGAEPGMPEPRYDNDIELANLREAFDEARGQPPLDATDKESERQQLEQSLGVMLSRIGAPAGGKWSRAAEQQLDEALQRLNDLLKLVGLSVTSYGHLG
jgi:hypothetical protein